MSHVLLLPFGTSGSIFTTSNNTETNYGGVTGSIPAPVGVLLAPMGMLVATRRRR